MGYADVATVYAERYGIVQYHVKGNTMTFYKSYPAYLGNKAYSIKHFINLDTGIETTQRMNKVFKEGFYNR